MGRKIMVLSAIALVGAAAAFGYFKQADVMDEASTVTATNEANAAPLQPAPTALNSKEVEALLKITPADITLGDATAPVTVVEYSSLSCPHCAHFHEAVLPMLEKDYITPGKVRLVVRHFPLNAPALKGATLVECAGENGQNRAAFVKTLFDMQAKWAFDDSFEKNLKQIAGVGGIDSAAFDGCMKDKALEDRILAGRQKAEKTLHITGTPAFFINGVEYTGERSIDGFRKALDAARK